MRRQAEKGNLRFPLNAPTKHKVSTAGLAASFAPDNAMEAEIARVLREGGMDERGVAQRARKSLGETTRAPLPRARPATCRSAVTTAIAAGSSARRTRSTSQASAESANTQRGPFDGSLAPESSGPSKTIQTSASASKLDARSSSSRRRFADALGWWT